MNKFLFIHRKKVKSNPLYTVNFCNKHIHANSALAPKY